jgi:DNA polymerase-3 subunit beta
VAELPFKLFPLTTRRTGTVLKFQVNRDAFNEAVSFVVRVLPQRIPMPILNGILIEADANALRLSVFDYEVSAQVEIVAKVDAPGRVLVSGRLLSEITSKLPNAPIEVSLEGNKVQVTCGASKFSLLTMPVEEYPNLPEIPETNITVSGEDFSKAIQQLTPAVAKNDHVMTLNGILFEVEEKNISMLGTDRNRMAVKEVPWSGKPGLVGYISVVPLRTLSEVAKTFGHQGELTLSINNDEARGLIAFKANNRTITSLLIKGRYPDIKEHLPKTDIPDFAIVNTQDLIDSTRRVGLVLENDVPMKCEFLSGKLVLEASENEVAQASEAVPIEMTGDDKVIKLRPRYVIDGLTGVTTEFTKISFMNNGNPNKPSPVLISSHNPKDEKETDNFRYVLQPHRL